MLTENQRRDFDENGYLVLENVLDVEQVIAPIEREYDTLLASLCDAWVSQGRLPALPTGSTFEDRIKAAYAAGREYFQPLDISLPGDHVQHDTPMHTGPAVFNMLTDTKLLDVVESLIGSEITSNPIQHVRIKPPAKQVSERENRSFITYTAWHQDRAVTLAEADKTRMVTTWIAMTDATLANGCLQVIPGSHRGEMLTHCPNPQLGIPDQLVENMTSRPVPVGKGGVIVFHPLTIHGSGHNQTEHIRWSFDVRFNVTGDPTGRTIFPDFVARSRNHPERELHDAAVWRQLWNETRHRLAEEKTPQQIHRWPADGIPCA